MPNNEFPTFLYQLYSNTIKHTLNNDSFILSFFLSFIYIQFFPFFQIFATDSIFQKYDRLFEESILNCRKWGEPSKSSEMAS